MATAQARAPRREHAAVHDVRAAGAGPSPTVRSDDVGTGGSGEWETVTVVTPVRVVMDRGCGRHGETRRPDDPAGRERTSRRRSRRGSRRGGTVVPGRRDTRAVILARVSRVPEPVGMAAVSVLAVAGSAWLDLATTPAERAAAAPRPAPRPPSPGSCSRSPPSSCSTPTAGHGRPAARRRGLVWTVDGVLSGWTTYGYAHDLPGTDVAFWFVARFGAVLLSGVVGLLLSTRPVACCPGAGAGQSPCWSRRSRCRSCCCSPPTRWSSPTASRTSRPRSCPPADRRRLGAAAARRAGADASARSSPRWYCSGSGTGRAAEERTQVRWLLWAAIMCVLLVVVGATVSVGGLGHDRSSSTSP